MGYEILAQFSGFLHSYVSAIFVCYLSGQIVGSCNGVF